MDSGATDPRADARAQIAQLSWHPGDDLTLLEEEMLGNAPTGELVGRSVRSIDSAEMQAWGSERTVRAAVIRYLLTSDQRPIDAKGVRLRGLRISGNLDLQGITSRCPLSMDSCYLDADRPVSLDRATVPYLALTNCHLAGLEGRMLSSREIDLSGSILTGPLLLSGADIAGQLNCCGVQLKGKDENGNALVAFGAKIGGDILLHPRFAAAGAVHLSGADIAGQLNCRGARLSGRNNDGFALFADGMKTGGHVLLDANFVAAAAVRLAGADIGGQLNCESARVAGDDSRGYAFIAEGLKVGENVFLDGGFTAAGTIVLRSARISGSVIIELVEFTSKDQANQGKTALNLAEAKITGQLEWLPTQPFSGEVNLEGASVGQLEDNWSDGRSNGFWPIQKLRLDGFTYARFGGNHQATGKQRLEWIRSQYTDRGTTPFTTQPYEQLAGVYRRAGQDSDGRRVAVARRADLRNYGRLNFYRRAVNWLLGISIQYGYQTWRAAVGLVVLYGLIWLLAACVAQKHNLIIPIGDFKGSTPSAANCDVNSSYPCFYPAGYAIDTVVPIINIHQADHWGPNGHAHFGWLWVAGTWVATVLGWALATLLVAGYTGLVRRDD